MFSRVWIYCSFLVLLSGCIYSDEPMPEISRTYPLNESWALKPSAPVRQQVRRDAAGVPAAWLPPLGLEKKWTAIIIHHSGTTKGNAAIFDRWHREGRHWDGVGYDFVIGNGSDSGDGEVEVTFRWRGQKTGAHCGGTPGNWANEEGIGICLVGDFDKTRPTWRQMRSLVKLVRFLQKRYGISKSRVYGHNTTPGAHKTDCPGKNFPMAKLKSMLY